MEQAKVIEALNGRCTLSRMPDPTDEALTAALACALELPVLVRGPGETDRAWLARRIAQLQPFSPHWREYDLARASIIVWLIAPQQICADAADAVLRRLELAARFALHCGGAR